MIRTLIAQVSDLHLHSDPAHISHVRFAAVLDHLLRVDPLPDILILSGDLSETGDEQSYRSLSQALERWPQPVHLMVGNHDDREALARVFSTSFNEHGFIQETVEIDGVRLILLDTTEEGRQGGAFCEERARWLRDELVRSNGTSTLIFMHHPPVDLGLPWLDPGEAQGWTRRLRVALEGQRIAAICTGHAHSSASLQWNGTPVVVCPSTSSDASMMFSDMCPDRPDGRPLLERGEPSFALHRWSGDQLVTFFVRSPEHVIARWDAETQPAVAAMIAERCD